MHNFSARKQKKMPMGMQGETVKPERRVVEEHSAAFFAVCSSAVVLVPTAFLAAASSASTSILIGFCFRLIRWLSGWD